jgi:hypothetical protein
MYQIAIIDDKFPYDINLDVTDLPFGNQKIENWINNKDWGEEGNLKHLIERIMELDLFKHKEIEVLAFLYPAALINYLKNNSNPQLLIFDWEYQTKNKDTKSQLIEIINDTTSFIFIYSALADSIWQLFLGNVFEKNISRLQLLKKGENKLSLFTSEDNIIQFIISQFNKAYEFKLGQNSVRFEENDFLKSPSSIFILESILGKEFLLQKLTESNFEISNSTIESIFSDVKTKFYLSKDKRYLLEFDNENNRNKYGPLQELSFLKTLKNYDLKIIDKTLERGIALIQ